MFHNDNGGTPRKLARASLRHSMGRNGFIAFSIALAACLVMVVALYFTGQARQYRNDAVGRYQASLLGLDEEGQEALRTNDAVAQVGLYMPLDAYAVEDYRLNISFMDGDTVAMAKLPAMDGVLPVSENEIVVEQAYLDRIGHTGRLGSILPLTIDDVQGEYVISGILSGQNPARSYMVLVSRALADRLGSNEPYSAYIRLADSDSWSEEQIKGEIVALASKLGLAESEVVFSSYYFNLRVQSSVANLLLAAGIAAVVAIACAVVIYSLFYVSVIGKTNEYGLLRLIGTTQKQVRRIVLREGMALAGISIPIGVLLGAAAGYFIAPAGWHWPTTLLVALATVILLCAVVLASIQKPVRLAGRVTPVEALRQTSYADDSRTTHARGLHRSLTPARLAWMNLMRNRKKTVLTILSLGFCGVLLLTGASYLNSINYADMARANNPVGDLFIELGSDGPWAYEVESFNTLQADNPLDESLVNALATVEGIERIHTYAGVYAEIGFPSGAEDPYVVHGFTRTEQAYLENILENGTAAYDELLARGGALICSQIDWRALYGWEAAIGDRFSVSTPSGGSVELTVMGFVSRPTEVGYSNIIVPDAMLAQIAPGVENPTYYLALDAVPAYLEAAEEEVRVLLATSPDLALHTLRDETARYEEQISALKLPIYFLVLFIGLFGLVNLVNTLLTNVLVRTKELSVLQTLGLTGRQLRHMLLLEGLYYVLGTALLTLSVGTAGGWLLCKAFDTIGVMGKVVYRFPIGQAAIYFMVILAAQFIFSLLSLNLLKSRSLVERMRGA